MATASAKSKQLLAEIAAKKTVKPAAKKPASKSEAPKKPLADAKSVATPKKQTPLPVATKATSCRALYTIRLEPDLIAKLEARGKKDGVSHAEIARRAIAAYFGA